MKVVQLLYSYLLTRSDFKIAGRPEKDTRDNRFAYQTYLSTLALMIDLSGCRVNSNKALSAAILGRAEKLSTQLVRALAADPQLREALAGDVDLFDYEKAEAQILDSIIASEAYKEFARKRKKEIANEVELWIVILDTVVAKSDAMLKVARAHDDFSLAGFIRGIDMVKSTLGAYIDNRASLQHARQALESSLDKAYELYHLLLLLPVAITRVQEQRLETAKEKYMPSSEDLNPDTRFVDNEYVKLICSSEDMDKYLEAHPINLDAEYLTVKRMLDDVVASDIYKEYMSAPATDRERDCEFWRAVMRTVILPSDALAEMLENSSVYWNDDLEIMGTFALKTMRHIASSTGEAKLLPQYKDSDDAEFGMQLFTDTVANQETYRGYIDRFIDTDHWDRDRLAFMDIVVMLVAISELLNFPSIPVAVTFNEYIEIANSYSTPRSGQFVNGMLYSILNYLKSEGKLLKE